MTSPSRRSAVSVTPSSWSTGAMTRASPVRGSTSRGRCGPVAEGPTITRSVGGCAAVSCCSAARFLEFSSNHTRTDRFPWPSEATAVVSGCVAHGAQGCGAARSELPGAATKPAEPAVRREPRCRRSSRSRRRCPSCRPPTPPRAVHPRPGRVWIVAAGRTSARAPVIASRRQVTPRPPGATPMRPSHADPSSAVRTTSAVVAPCAGVPRTGVIATGWSRPGREALSVDTSSHAGAGPEAPSAQVRSCPRPDPQQADGGGHARMAP